MNGHGRGPFRAGVGLGAVLAAALVMQGVGNLVALDGSGHPVWDAGTEGHAGARLAVQDDGNLVVYSAHDKALWASGTSG
jgi:hypothetical protein